MTSKRAHKTLTLEEKLKILQELGCGVSATKLAVKYGIGTSTVTDIKKRRQYIENFVDKSASSRSSRKTLKGAKYDKIEDTLHSWIVRQRERQAPISHETLAGKAKELYAKCYGNGDFRASKGWIRNFNKRHGSCLVKTTGKEVSRGSSAIPTLKKKLQNDEGAFEEKDTSFTVHQDSLPYQENREEISNNIERVKVEVNPWICGKHGCGEEEPFECKLKAERGEEEDNEDNSVTLRIRHDEAVQSFHICVEWAKQNNIELHEIRTLERLKEKALLLCHTSKEQEQHTFTSGSLHNVNVISTQLGNVFM